MDYPIVKNEIGSGRPITVGLFYELQSQADAEPIFTLKKQDHKGYLSIFRLYDEFTSNDPTEFIFAEKVFGNWKYWQDIVNTTKIKPYIQEMREIAEAKRKSKVLTKISEKIEAGTANYSEQKLYYDFFNEKPVKKKAKAPEEPSNISDVNDDFKRLGIV